MFGMDNRASCLSSSLLIEKSLSAFLSSLLDIKDEENSLSFSNKTSALSFRAKVNMLLDMNVFDKKEDNWKLEKFMEIRNQFMHNFEASTFEKCYSYVSGAQNKILKEYPQDATLPLEEQLKKATGKLASECLDIVQKVFKRTLEKKVSESNKVALASVAMASKDAINELHEKAQSSADTDKISVSEYWDLLEKKIKDYEGRTFDVTVGEITFK